MNLIATPTPVWGYYAQEGDDIIFTINRPARVLLLDDIDYKKYEDGQDYFNRKSMWYYCRKHESPRVSIAAPRRAYFQLILECPIGNVRCFDLKVFRTFQGATTTTRQII